MTTLIDELRQILLDCPIENAIDLRITCSKDGVKSNLKFKYGIGAQKKYPTLIESLESTFNELYDQICSIATDLPDRLNKIAQEAEGPEQTWTEYRVSPNCKYDVEYMEQDWENNIIEASHLVNTISLCQSAIKKPNNLYFTLASGPLCLY